MMSPIELKCCYQFGFLIPLAQQLCCVDNRQHQPCHPISFPMSLWLRGARKEKMLKAYLYYHIFLFHLLVLEVLSIAFCKICTRHHKRHLLSQDFHLCDPLSQAGKMDYQAAMRQLGCNQPFRVAGQPNLKFTRRKLHL